MRKAVWLYNMVMASDTESRGPRFQFQQNPPPPPTHTHTPILPLFLAPEWSASSLFRWESMGSWLMHWTIKPVARVEFLNVTEGRMFFQFFPNNAYAGSSVPASLSWAQIVMHVKDCLSIFQWKNAWWLVAWRHTDNVLFNIVVE